ncbi:hypothetical protein D3C73_1381270 [compost metagenome]
MTPDGAGRSGDKAEAMHAMTMSVRSPGTITRFPGLSSRRKFSTFIAATSTLPTSRSSSALPVSRSRDNDIATSATVGADISATSGIT